MGRYWWDHRAGAWAGRSGRPPPPPGYLGRRTRENTGFEIGREDRQNRWDRQLRRTDRRDRTKRTGRTDRQAGPTGKQRSETQDQTANGKCRNDLKTRIQHKQE